MPSPFPGMDPYLEAHWGDVHTALIMYVRDALRSWLPGDLYARVEERVYIESDSENRQLRIPDVRVLQSGAAPSHAHAPGATAILEPPESAVLELPEEEVTERFIEIRDLSSGHELVSVIEILSPANKKPGAGRIEYIRKVEQLRQGMVALLEIDLLRGGKPIFPAEQQAVAAEHRKPYRGVIWRPENPRVIESYSMSLREPLRPVPVPLRARDPDALLDLQALVTQAYENGDYAKTTDYSRPPVPPFVSDDAEWANEVIQRFSR